MKLRLGTRGSDLALWQARHVAALLSPEAEVELVILKTAGDRIDDRPLTEVPGKAFFTAEIERALLDGSVDLAVHSHKDLPTESPPGLVIAAVPPRGPAGERLLVSDAAHAPHAPLLPLRRGAVVGTSSPRREQQLRALRPDVAAASLRGNVPTRVRRLREGRFDAILLAAAGLHRLQLDLSGLHVHDLPADLLVPAPAQGALAIQVRAGDVALQELCARRLHDEETHARVAAERLLLSLAGGGCNLPLGAFVERVDGREAAHRHGHADARPLAGAPAATHAASAAVAAGPWRVRAFLGADHPRTGCAARWAEARGRTPEQAARAVLAVLIGGAPVNAGPLAGLSLAIAGSADDAHGSALGARLAQLGAGVRHEAWIVHEDLPAPGLAAAVASLARGDALAVTSRRAAARLAGLVVAEGVIVAAVGPSTADALAAAGLRAGVVGEHGGAALAEALPVAAGRRALLPCAEESRPELRQALAARGVRVEPLAVYRTRPATPPPPRARCDARIFSSPSAVAAAARAQPAPEPGVASFALGEATARALAEHGLPSPAGPSPQASAGEAGGVIETVVAALVHWRAHAARSEPART